MPAPVAPPPASTPPASSAPAAPPARSQTPNIPTEQPTGSWLDEAGAELEQIDEGNAPPPEKGAKPGKGRTAEPPPDERGTEDGQPDATDETPPGDKGKEKTEDGQQPPVEKTPSNIKKLREGYEERGKKIREELEPELHRLRTRVKELEETPNTAPDKAQVEKYQALERRNQELEAEIRFVDYTKSQEYQEKYDKPYREQWERALADLEELTVEDGAGNTRPANKDDLLRLARMKLGDARKAANEMFGDSADDVMFHVREIRRLADAGHAAKEEARKQAEQHVQESQTKTKEQVAARNKMWTQSNSELAQRFPLMFAPVQGDEDGNTLLQKGFALADYIFRNGGISEAERKLLPQRFQADLEANNGRLSPENLVRLHALVRNKAANHDRVVRRLNLVKKELAEAKKALAEYEDSSPPTGGTRGPRGTGRITAGNYLDEANAEIDKMDK